MFGLQSADPRVRLRVGSRLLFGDWTTSSWLSMIYRYFFAELKLVCAIYLAYLPEHLRVILLRLQVPLISHLAALATVVFSYINSTILIACLCTLESKAS